MNEHEEKMVSTFIAKEKRHRFRYFMDNVKIRSRELDCLNHTSVLDPRYTTWLSRKEDIVDLLRKEGSPDYVYIISMDKRIDQKTLPLEEAIAQVFEFNWGTIVSCIPGKLAYYHDEDGGRRALLKA